MKLSLEAEQKSNEDRVRFYLKGMQYSEQEHLFSGICTGLVIDDAAFRSRMAGLDLAEWFNYQET